MARKFRRLPSYCTEEWWGGSRKWPRKTKSSISGAVCRRTYQLVISNNSRRSNPMNDWIMKGAWSEIWWSRKSFVAHMSAKRKRNRIRRKNKRLMSHRWVRKGQRYSVNSQSTWWTSHHRHLRNRNFKAWGSKSRRNTSLFKWQIKIRLAQPPAETERVKLGGNLQDRSRRSFARGKWKTLRVHRTGLAWQRRISCRVPIIRWLGGKIRRS